MAFYKSDMESNFSVVNVDHEPYSESTWKLKFENYGPFILYDLFDTTLDDELLIGKSIKACVYLPGSIVDREERCSKSIDIEGVVISEVTGQLKQEFLEDGSYTYFLDSVFPIILDTGGKIDDFFPGKWVSAQTHAEYWIILPRGKNLK